MKKLITKKKFLLSLFLIVLGFTFALQTAVNANDSKPLDGKTIYTKHCSMCHTQGPPPKLAPPIFGLAKHYREAFNNKKAAVEHMVEYMQSPDSSKTKLGPRAFKRFGIMPAMTISERDLRVVSKWVWDQYDPNSPLLKRCK